METAAAEGLLHANHETRTVEESVLNTGAALLLGSAVGGAVSLKHSTVNSFVKETMNPSVSNLSHGSVSSLDYAAQANKALAGDVEQVFKDAGAAGVKKVAVEASSEALEVAGTAASKVAKAHAGHNPLLRTIHSSSKAVRNASALLMENSLVLQRNYTGDAVEALKAGIDKAGLDNLRVRLDDVEVKALDEAAMAKYKDDLAAAEAKAIEEVKRNKRYKRREVIEAKTKELVKKYKDEVVQPVKAIASSYKDFTTEVNSLVQPRWPITLRQYRRLRKLSKKSWMLPLT